jgi:hypothetical protein
MAEAVARLSRDGELLLVASQSASALSARDSAPPWHVVAVSSDGRPLIAAAAAVVESPASGLQPRENQLLIASAAAASDLITPLLMRAIVNSMAIAPDLAAAEVVPIPDPLLRAWSRPAPALSAPRVENIDRDDRQWLWAAALLLMAIETWMRRARRESGRESLQRDEGVSRVA